MSKRVALLTVVLALTTGSAAAAQSASPEATPDWQRVEFKDEGIAIELPAGWESIPYEGPGHESVVAVFVSAPGSTCGVSHPPSDGLRTVEDIEDVLAPTGYWAGLPGGYSTERVQTAAGAAVKVTYSEVREDLDATFWNALYFIPSGDGWYSVQCNFDEWGTRTHPDDDWISIAETFEFLPEEE